MTVVAKKAVSLFKERIVRTNQIISNNLNKVEVLNDNQYQVNADEAKNVFLRMQLDKGTAPDGSGKRAHLSLDVLDYQEWEVTKAIERGNLSEERAEAANIQLAFYQKLATLDTNKDNYIEVHEFKNSINEDGKFVFEA